MANHEWMEPTLREEAIPEQILSKEEFHQLASLVEHVCLSTPLQEARVRERDATRRLVDQLGVRGLRAALELVVSKDRFRAQDDEGRALTSSSPMKWHDLFSLERDDEVIEWAERFGSQLIAESYAILGRDADQQVERFRNATTVEEQVSVMEWLSERIRAIAEDPEADSVDVSNMTEDEALSIGLKYHPIRLSPKAIGQYPEVRIPPTCLGVSIVGTSFLERCGVDVMHAGVMASMHQQDLEDVIATQRKAIQEIEAYAGRTDITEALMRKADRLYQSLLFDRGFHAAVYAKLRDGTWYQLDPNYQASHHIDASFIVERLDEVHDTLTQFNHVAPGLEVATRFSHCSLSGAMRTKYESDDLEFTREWQARAAEILTDDNDESWVQRVYEFAIDRLRDLQASHTDAEAIRGNTALALEIFMSDVDSGLEEPDVRSQQNYMADIMYGMIEDYLLAGEAVEVLKERCRSDESYLTRKIQDIWAMAHLAHVTIISAGYDARMGATTHSAVELGLPAARIGMAVLSDFALYMRASLPASFWLTEWSSVIPATMANVEKETRPSQKILHNTLGWIADKSLYYFADYDKILETTAKLLNVESPEEVEQDGRSTEGR